MPNDSDRLTRRRVVALGAVVLPLGLAGCTDPGGEGEDGEQEDGEDGGDENGEDGEQEDGEEDGGGGAYRVGPPE